MYETIGSWLMVAGVPAIALAGLWRVRKEFFNSVWRFLRGIVLAPLALVGIRLYAPDGRVYEVGIGAYVQYVILLMAICTPVLGFISLANWAMGLGTVGAPMVAVLLAGAMYVNLGRQTPLQWIARWISEEQAANV